MHRYYTHYVCYPQFNFKGACPLTIYERVVYSYLAWRDRIGQGLTVPELRAAFPIDENANTAVQTLSQRGLLRPDKDKTYRAEPPRNEHTAWFAWKAPGQPQTGRRAEDHPNPSGRDVDDPGATGARSVKHWSDKIFTHSFYVKGPDWCPSLHALCVFNLLLDFDRQEKTVTSSGIASILSISRKTVEAAFKTLERAGLFRIRQLAHGKVDAEPLHLPDGKENWLLKKEEEDVKHEPLWKQELRQRKDISSRRLDRIDYDVKALAKWYPDEDPAKPYPRSWISPWDFQVYPSLHDYVRELIHGAIEAWDNTRFESPAMIIDTFLHRAIKTWRSRWENGHWHNHGDWLNFTDAQLANMSPRVRQVVNWHRERDIKDGGPEHRRRERERLPSEPAPDPELQARFDREQERCREYERRAEADFNTKVEPEPQPEPPEPRQSLRFRDMF